jgi:hypothetical protein
MQKKKRKQADSPKISLKGTEDKPPKKATILCG